MYLFLASVLSVLGSVASLAGLAITFREQGKAYSSLELALYMLAGFLTLVWVVVMFLSYRRSLPFTCRNDKKIKKFMLNWISHPGRAVIFTRDMTWGKEADVKAALLKKATDNELTIILEDHIELADELREAGAKVITYARLGHTPLSRFTIINKDRHDAQVAVGGKIGDKHVIYEYQQGHHPFFAVANDLADILIKYGNMADIPPDEKAAGTTPAKEYAR